eukprot:jgi/Bigna1/89465/estExt_fgenesh1_pg.C_490150
MNMQTKKELLGVLSRDVQFLRGKGLMDYSLILAMKRTEENGGAEEEEEAMKRKRCPPFPIRRFKLGRRRRPHAQTSSQDEPSDICSRKSKCVIKATYAGENYSAYVGLIDFLQDWNMKKKIARLMKFCEHNKSTEPPSFYADRILRDGDTVVKD